MSPRDGETAPVCQLLRLREPALDECNVGLLGLHLPVLLLARQVHCRGVADMFESDLVRNFFFLWASEFLIFQKYPENIGLFDIFSSVCSIFSRFSNLQTISRLHQLLCHSRPLITSTRYRATRENG